MTGGAIIALAVAATGLLALGARLLESPSPVMIGAAVLALVLGTALAAAAVAGAWRTPAASSPDAEGR